MARLKQSRKSEFKRCDQRTMSVGRSWARNPEWWRFGRWIHRLSLNNPCRCPRRCGTSGWPGAKNWLRPGRRIRRLCSRRSIRSRSNAKLRHVGEQSGCRSDISISTAYFFLFPENNILNLSPGRSCAINMVNSDISQLACLIKSEFMIFFPSYVDCGFPSIPVTPLIEVMPMSILRILFMSSLDG